MNEEILNNYLKISYRDRSNTYPKKLVKHLFGDYIFRMKILDLGCGNGIITKEIQNLGHYATGADACSDASNVIGSHNYVKIDLSKNLPFEENTFDVVFCKSVIEHLHDPDILFSNVKRILSPGGKFICMTPSWKHSYKEQFYIEHTHVTPFTRLSLKTIGEFHGFESKCCYFYQLPYLWKFPKLRYFNKLVSILNIPYRPFYEVPWPDSMNKFLRFSKEVMLLGEFQKP